MRDNVEMLSSYRHGEDGALYKITGKGDVLISGSYIKLIAMIRTPERTEWFNLVEFNDMDGKRRSMEIPCDTLLDSKETLQLLARAGFSKIYCRKPIMDYLKTALPSERIVRIKKSGWINDKEYACPSFQVTNNDNSYSLTSSKNCGFSKNGTLEEWKNSFCRYCENNSVLTFLGVGLSGVLLRFPAIGSNAINLIGRSSIGKTSALCVAASLWGTKKFMQQWRSTSNALEAVAESHNDGLLVLDELGQISSKDLGNIVYMLGNEKGKSRLTADSELRKSKEWRIAILSSGEIGIVDKIAEAGEKAKAGQMVRFIDIDAQISDLNGIYEDVHQTKSGANLSNLLKENCTKYHGVAAEEFVKRLAADDGAQGIAKSVYDQTKNEFIEKFGLSEADPIVIRVAETMALYITTGILASSDYCGIFTHNAIGIEKAIYDIFGRWLADRGGKKSVEDHAIIEHVIGFLMQHESRFRKIHDFEERTIINCLGFMEKTRTDATIFYVIPKLFREEMCKGMNVKMVRKILKKASILEIDADGKNPKCPAYVHERRLRLITLVVTNSLTNER